MRAVLLLFIFIFSTSQVVAQSEEARKKNFNVKKDIALEGYDPVSYFENQPAEGVDNITYTYKGVTYQFTTIAHQAAFKMNPDKYEPAYGGWCAYAMGATGEKVKIDPETFKVLDGKLYLFYNFWGNNTLTTWNKNEKQLMMAGDKNWRRFAP